MLQNSADHDPAYTTPEKQSKEPSNDPPGQKQPGGRRELGSAEHERLGEMYKEMMKKFK